MKIIKKGDFVELEFTGKANGEVFDSNIPEDLKKINPDSDPKKTIVVVGERMIVPGLDDELEGKEIGKEYSTSVSSEKGFGQRNKSMVKTIPLRVFTEQKVNPKPGATFFLDNTFVKIIAVSGARVITDFNHPLAGKDLKYKFKIIKEVTEDKEKAEALFEFYFRTVPKFEISTDEVLIKGDAHLKAFADLFGEKFKKLLNKELKFEESKPVSTEEKPSTE